MKKLLCLLVFLLSVIIINAQSNTISWVRGMGGIDQDDGKQVKADANGNVYTVGIFKGTADFDPGPGVFNLTVTPGYYYSTFISKLDSNGNFVWARKLAGEGDVALAIDALNNVYISGNFQGTFDFDPGPSIFNLSASPMHDNYVLKLNSIGNFIWAKKYGGASLTGLSTDASGNVYSIGEFFDSVDFDPGPGVAIMRAPGGTALFISKLDSSGNFLWVKSIEGSGFNFIRSVAVDKSGNVYATGVFSGTADFDPGALAYNFSSVSGSRDIFILKLDINGKFVWAKQLGWITDDEVQAIALDSAGNVFTTGSFKGTVDFDPDTGTYYLSSNGILYDIFILKLNSKGEFIWAKKIGGKADDGGASIALDAAGNIYTTGSFQLTVDFDPGLDSFTLSSAGYEDIFILKLNSDGKFEWAKKMGGTGHDIGWSIDIAANGSLYVTGWYWLIADFFPGQFQYALSSAGFDDVFVLKLKSCTPTYSTYSDSICDNFIYNKIKYSSSGVFNQFLINSKGCDSIIILNLTLRPVNKNVQQTGALLTSGAIGAVYQWVECPGYNIMNGANTRSYLATSNSDYAVIVTQNGCTDTSLCYTVSTAGIKDNSEAHSIRIFPDPSNGTFTLYSDINSGIVNIEIYNSCGQQILSRTVSDGPMNIDLTSQPSGVYFVKLSNGNNVIRVSKVLIKN